MSGVLTIEKTVAITIDKVSLVWLPDDSAETEGCTAFAYVSYPARGREHRSEWFASVGIWGMPSDIPKDARKEIEQEQLADLKQHGVICISPRKGIFQKHDSGISISSSPVNIGYFNISKTIRESSYWTLNKTRNSAFSRFSRNLCDRVLYLRLTRSELRSCRTWNTVGYNQFPCCLPTVIGSF